MINKHQVMLKHQRMRRLPAAISLHRAVRVLDGIWPLFPHKERNLQKTPRRVTRNRMQTSHPHHSFPSVTAISLIAPVWALDIIPAFSEAVELQFFFDTETLPLPGTSWICSRSGGDRRAGSRWWQRLPGAAAAPSQRCSPGNRPTWPTLSPARRASAPLRKTLCSLLQTCIVTGRNITYTNKKLLHYLRVTFLTGHSITFLILNGFFPLSSPERPLVMVLS